jgi:hypothetical protein
MAFRRAVLPASSPGTGDLTSVRADIGMRLAAEPAADPNIEDTLLHGSLEGMEGNDQRVLALLVT